MRFSSNYEQFRYKAIRFAIVLTIVIVLVGILIHLVAKTPDFQLIFLFDIVSLLALSISYFTLSPKTINSILIANYTILITMVYVIKIAGFNPYILIWYPPIAMSATILADTFLAAGIVIFALVMNYLGNLSVELHILVSTSLAIVAAALFGWIIKSKMVEFANEIIKLKEFYYNLATIDTLTQLHNRRYFYQECQKILKLAIRKKRPVSLLIFDLDYFKKVNDNYGHLKGDEVLKEFAITLKKNLREYDLVARIGGEEFSVCIYDEPLPNIVAIAQKIRKAVENIKIDERKNLTVSIGITHLIPSKTTSIENLLYKADQALYRAKELGRNRVEVYVHKN